jgi:transcription termination factor Rho
MYDILELSKKLLPELREIAKELKIKKAETLKKQDLVYKILDQQAIELTEAKSAARKETEKSQNSGERFNHDRDSAHRRGKRPRTNKPVPTRPPESVISVSPDGQKKNEVPTESRREPLIGTEKIEEKQESVRTCFRRKKSTALETATACRRHKSKTIKI